MRNDIIVSKMIGYIQKIESYCSGLDYQRFSCDSQLVDACVFNLSQLGELANKVDDDFAEMHANIPWRILYGLRNRIVHDYDGVNLILIWQIITENLESLKNSLTEIL